ncbi:MAG: hypothetical protein J5944_11780, partial [Lentisphaeria bacterium]|nr:hypothetical protein [Lentisphaeria bacterium]
SLHKKTDHTTFGMIRICLFSCLFGLLARTSKRKRGPLKPALPTPGKGGISDEAHINEILFVFSH